MRFLIVLGIFFLAISQSLAALARLPISSIEFEGASLSFEQIIDTDAGDILGSQLKVQIEGILPELMDSVSIEVDSEKIDVPVAFINVRYSNAGPSFVMALAVTNEKYIKIRNAKSITINFVIGKFVLTQEQILQLFTTNTKHLRKV